LWREYVGFVCYQETVNGTAVGNFKEESVVRKVDIIQGGFTGGIG
jgi:hypothetical protein